MLEIDSIVKEKANYCLNCKVPFCKIKGCPMQTNIPQFIECIKNNNLEEAYNILKENNICSDICSIVCPQEEQCEGSCIRGIKSNPTEIGYLERFVNEWVRKNNIKYVYKKNKLNGKKVCIIGSGPASIECAKELLIAGFNIDIFEKEDTFGGILNYGIPDFRLNKELVKRLQEEIENLGANIYFNKELGKDLHIDKLKEEYDAVFLGIGAEKSTTYSLSENIDNNKILNVFDSDDFLKHYNSNNFYKNLGIVVVIGGGNVAMDSARAAIRMGAKEVKILYRRDEEHMPARKIELQEAILDGVKFKELIRVDTANLDEKNNIISLNCVRTEIIDGRAKDKIPEERFIEEANTVVFAIGLKPNQKLIENEGFKLNQWGYIDLDENGKSSFNNVFAGGDIFENKATVCRALAAGKRSAMQIIKELN